MTSWTTFSRRDPAKQPRGEGAEALSELISDLHDLVAESSRLLAKGAINFSGARAMAEHIAEARALLTELSGERGRGVADSGITGQFALLKEQFFELEGRVKELRNSLEGTGGQK